MCGPDRPSGRTGDAGGRSKSGRNGSQCGLVGRTVGWRRVLSRMVDVLALFFSVPSLKPGIAYIHSHNLSQDRLSRQHLSEYSEVQKENARVPKHTMSFPHITSKPTQFQKPTHTFYFDLHLRKKLGFSKHSHRYALSQVSTLTGIHSHRYTLSQVHVCR